MIRVFDNAIPNQVCEDIIKFTSSFEEINPDTSQRSFTGNNTLDRTKLSLFDSPNKRFLTTLLDNDNPFMTEVMESVSARLGKFLSELELSAKVLELVLDMPPEFEEWKIKKYPPGGFFSLHVDAYAYTNDNSIPIDAKGTVVPGEWQMYDSDLDRWTYHNRFIGIFIYLNTIEGSGETVFYDGPHVSQTGKALTVPAKQGTMVMFDFIDNPIHEGKPVVDDNKWFLGSYFHVRGWRDV